MSILCQNAFTKSVFFDMGLTPPPPSPQFRLQLLLVCRADRRWSWANFFEIGQCWGRGRTSSKPRRIPHKEDLKLAVAWSTIAMHRDPLQSTLIFTPFKSLRPAWCPLWKSGFKRTRLQRCLFKAVKAAAANCTSLKCGNFIRKKKYLKMFQDWDFFISRVVRKW